MFGCLSFYFFQKDISGGFVVIVNICGVVEEIIVYPIICINMVDCRRIFEILRFWVVFPVLSFAYFWKCRSFVYVII